MPMQTAALAMLPVPLLLSGAAGAPALAPGGEAEVVLRVLVVVSVLFLGLMPMAYAASLTLSMGKVERWTLLVHWVLVAALGQLETGRLIGWSIVGQALAHGSSMNHALLLGAALGQVLPWIVACGAVFHAMAPVHWPPGMPDNDEEKVWAKSRFWRTVMLLVPAMTAAFVCADVWPQLWALTNGAPRGNGGPLGAWIAGLSGAGLAGAGIDARLETATGTAMAAGLALAVVALVSEGRLRRKMRAAREKAEAFAAAIAEGGAARVEAPAPPPSGPVKARGAAAFGVSFGFMNIAIAIGSSGMIYLLIRSFSAALEIESFDMLASMKKAWGAISGAWAGAPGLGAVAVCAVPGIMLGAAVEGICRGRRDLASTVARLLTISVALWPLGALARTGAGDGGAGGAHGLLLPVASLAAGAVVAGGVAIGAGVWSRWTAALAVAIGGPLFVQGGDWTSLVIADAFFVKLLEGSEVAPSMVALFPDYTAAALGVMFAGLWLAVAAGPALLAMVSCTGAKSSAQPPKAPSTYGQPPQYPGPQAPAPAPAPPAGVAPPLPPMPPPGSGAGR